MLERVRSLFLGPNRFYYVSTSVLLVWMFVLDTNDLSVQYRLSSELADLKAEHDYYRHKLKELKQERAAVMGNPALLEKYAREKYFMKRPSEDIFVIVDQENQQIEK
ncbi:FtsB family cell division protein [Aquirufa antheringensis]